MARTPASALQRLRGTTLQLGMIPSDERRQRPIWGHTGLPRSLGVEAVVAGAVVEAAASASVSRTRSPQTTHSPPSLVAGAVAANGDLGMFVVQSLHLEL